MSALSDWWEDWKTGAKKISDAYNRTDLVDIPSALYDYATDPKRLADDFAAGAIPAATMGQLSAAFLSAQKALDLTYGQVQRIKALPVKPDLSSLERKQQTDYAQYQSLLYCFWAVPTFAYEFRRVGIRPPVAKYALATAGGIGDSARKIAKILQDNGVSKELSGLGELGATAIITIVAILGSLVAGAIVWCQAISESNLTEREKARNETIQICVQSGKCDADMIDALRKGDAGIENPPDKNPLKNIGTILMWVAVIGAGVVFLPTLLSAGKAGQEVIDARRAKGFSPQPALQGYRRRRW